MPARRVIAGPVLGRRALNRAILERQFLLRRVPLSVGSAIEHLVAMQAQVPRDPYVALWSRLEGFDPDALSRLIETRRVVRATSMLRTTIHLMTADDWLALRPVLQTVSERGFLSGSPFGRRLAGLPIDLIVATGRAMLDEQPRSISALAGLLHERWPEGDPSSLSYAVRYLVPLVQIPPRGLWKRSGQPILATPESWLGRSVGTDTAPDAMLLRYLAAFGPATVQDMQTWCWLTRLGPIVERLRPELRTFRDENGRELFDLPDAPLPDPETPAPPRFLPTYDNIALSHKDRTRIYGDLGNWTVAGDALNRVFAGGSLLVDGFVLGGWHLERDGKTTSLLITPLRPLESSDRPAVLDEGARLLDLLTGESPDVDIRFEAMP
jgi:hypothetical protein